MIKSLITLLFTIFFLSATIGIAQVASVKDEAKGVELKKTEPVTDSRNSDVNKNDDKQAQNTGDKNGSVKQVKSARPDMSRSRGARPPDIVRPSGSRIPKGVGRPAGAGRRGRG